MPVASSRFAATRVENQAELMRSPEGQCSAACPSGWAVALRCNATKYEPDQFLRDVSHGAGRFLAWPMRGRVAHSKDGIRRDMNIDIAAQFPRRDPLFD